MAQSKFTLYKYIKLKDGSWRYCRAAFYSNAKIKPNRCIVGGKEEEHPEGAYYLNHNKQWIVVGTDALEAQRQRNARLDDDEFKRLQGTAPEQSLSIVPITKMRTLADAAGEWCNETEANRKRKDFEAEANGPRLKEQRSEFQRQAANIIHAISKHGISPLLSAELATLETRLAEIDQQLAAKPASKRRVFSAERIREFLQQSSQQFCDVLLSDPARAKQEIQKRITKLVLTPKDTSEGRRLEVTGDVGLFSGDGVMENRSLEGIAQHYILPRIALANVVLDPTLPVAA
jgi:hypothetical protein